MTVRTLVEQLAMLSALRDTLKELVQHDDGMTAEDRQVFILVDNESFEIDTIDGDGQSVYIKVVE